MATVEVEVAALDAALGLAQHLADAPQPVEPVDRLRHQSVTADGVARRSGLVEQQDVDALTREKARGGGSTGPGPHDDDVMDSHGRSPPARGRPARRFCASQAALVARSRPQSMLAMGSLAMLTAARAALAR